MSKPLKFKISSALKDIIGRDLITDDFIAVFELVKNSYDAHATRVDIVFENIGTKKARIIIKDNGKGMNYEDLINKWLFVAYSAKKDGTEDDNFDYRDKIYTNRPFSGAKGIGRFSCDRLGKNLLLESTKKEKTSKTEVLITNWEQFEGNLKDEFVNINVLHQSKKKSDFGLKHGTVLVIDELRGEWDRDKYLRLKDSLAKLINPNRGRGEHNFKIVIQVDQEKEDDKLVQEEYKKINGEVKNFIFETLGVKTTKINSCISEDGKFLTTELFDGGTRIYKVKEINKYKLLDNVDYTIYYLNRSAKTIFTKKMGIQSVNYGHIFLYKNGFRIYPYGEPGEDPLKIDRRKAQGHSRYLGTREIIGQIEIFSENNELKETSSRGDGLIKTSTYNELENCFWVVLKRLEKYVVDVQEWGLNIDDSNHGDDINKRVTELIAKLTESKEIVEFEYADNFLELVENNQNNSAVVVVDNLKRIAADTKNDDLLSAAKKVEKKLKGIQKFNQELELEKSLIETEKTEIEKKLHVKEKENELLKQASNDDIVELMSIEHHVNQASFRVEKYLKELYSLAKSNKDLKIPMEEWINKISLENKKIASLVKFVRKANFDLLSSKVTEDLVKYIDQYISNVYKSDRIKIINKELIKNVIVNYPNKLVFKIQFIPLEFNIILDNLLDNSFKASSTNVEIRINLIKDSLKIDYFDDGVGIDESIKDDIFEFGITTTGGSGIGLYHIRTILEKLKGNIKLKNSKRGAHFEIVIPKYRK